MEVSLESILKADFFNRMDNLNFCCPAVIVNIQDLPKGFVDVQPLPNNVSNNGETTEYPVIGYVPVMIMATNASAVIPSINLGDTCLLVFGHSDITPFKFGIEKAYDPSDNRLLDLNDAIALIGLKTSLKSVFNATSHKNKLNLQDMTIVHNLGKPNENCIKLKLDGSIDFISSTEVNFDVPVVNCNTLNASEDVIIGGQSVMQFMLSHTHNYTDDGNPAITSPPNPL